MRGLKRFFSHWQNWLGFLLVLGFLFVALAAPILSPDDEKKPGPFRSVGRVTDYTPYPPSEIAPLGTLPGQVDVYHALISGTREAVGFGLMVALGSFAFGVLFGAVSGYAGGMVNSLMMRIADAFLTFPLLAGVAFLQQLVAVTIQAKGGIYYFDTASFGKVVLFLATPPAWVSFLLKVDPLLISLILFSWMPFARLVNTIVLTLKRTDFIQAARALGGGPLWIIFRHLIPNSIGPAVVMASRDVGNAVILQATFTFIGMGSNSPWGILLSMGRDWIIGPGGDIFAYWWVFIPATLAVVLFGISWNIVGDGLNDALLSTSRSGTRMPGTRKKKVDDGTSRAEKMPAPSTEDARNPLHGRQTSQSEPAVKASSLHDSTAVLLSAREALSRNELASALHAYHHLIQHNRLTDEILSDLARLAKKYPRDPQVWQTLGDALSRIGDAEHAAQSYAQARNLMNINS